VKRASLRSQSLLTFTPAITNLPFKSGSQGECVPLSLCLVKSLVGNVRVTCAAFFFSRRYSPLPTRTRRESQRVLTPITLKARAQLKRRGRKKVTTLFSNPFEPVIYGAASVICDPYQILEHVNMSAAALRMPSAPKKSSELAMGDGKMEPSTVLTAVGANKKKKKIVFTQTKN